MRREWVWRRLEITPKKQVTGYARRLNDHGWHTAHVPGSPRVRWSTPQSGYWPGGPPSATEGKRPIPTALFSPWVREHSGRLYWYSLPWGLPDMQSGDSFRASS